MSTDAHPNRQGDDLPADAPVPRNATPLEWSGSLIRMIDRLPMIIGYVSAPSLTYQLSNRAHSAFCGRPREEIIGRTPQEVLGDAAWKAVEPLIVRTLRGERTQFQKRYPRPDGRFRYLEVTYDPDRNDRGEVAGAYFYARDISKRKEAEDALIESERTYRGYVDHAPTGILVLDRDGHCLEANNAASRMTGFRHDELCRMRISELFAPAHQEEGRRHLLQAWAEGQARTEIGIQQRQGRRVFWHLDTSRLTQERLLAFAVDTTHRHEMESQLRHAQKLEALGTLAGGIAHEINTPTQYVGDNLRFLQEAFKELSDATESIRAIMKNNPTGDAPELAQIVLGCLEQADVPYLLEEIPSAIEQSLDGVERVTKIVRAMKEFSHPGSGEKTLFDLNRSIQTTVDVCRNEWKYVADMVLDLQEEISPAYGYPSEFNQAILNLITNAAHSIGDRLGPHPEQKGEIKIQTALVDGCLEIRLTDSGQGIPEGIRPRVFDPFFTTKEVGKGTGQGLSLTHQIIVEKHGGQLDFESEVGVGTCFRIRLPLEVDLSSPQDETLDGTPRQAGQPGESAA